MPPRSESGRGVPDLVNVLVVNPGSSSLKLRVLDRDDRALQVVDLPASGGHCDETKALATLADIGDADAVGYRIVHGGSVFTSSVVIDGSVVEALRSLGELAPLHQPASLRAIEAVSRVLPELPGVACFDTAFHAAMPESAATYAVPREWRERYGVRRYGFHGLSHAYASRRACEIVGRFIAGMRVVTCHLGAGCSSAAVVGGRSVDTTMGFTPLEGLVMETRSGSVDPGLILWLQEQVGLTASEIGIDLERHSGLLGLSGTSDMREVLSAYTAGHEDARLAIDVYVHRVRASIAAMVASMGGIDVLAFTGGVGENSPEIRQRTVESLGFLGIAIDDELNQTACADTDVSAAGSPVRTVVVLAREDVEIAREVRRLIEPGTEATDRQGR